MYAVGVDVSNGWSTVAVLQSKTDIAIRPFNVRHNSQGFASLLEKLSAQLVRNHRQVNFLAGAYARGECNCRLRLETDSTRCEKTAK